MKTNNEIEYKENFEKFQSGKITEAAWVEYCRELYNEILEQNKEVFKRLKYR
jgi:hypothetical protein